MKRQITEYLVADLNSEKWCCSRCSKELGSLRENYKKFTLIHERDPREIYQNVIEQSEYTFSPDPEWCRIIEFYCPHCGTMIEIENLPPGHPITHDIELDVDALKRESKKGGEINR